MELVLAIAGTMFPAIFFTSLKDCCWMLKQCILKFAALLIKWMMSSSSFSNTTDPNLPFCTFSLCRDSVNKETESSFEVSLSCWRNESISLRPSPAWIASIGNNFIFLAKIWLSLLSVSDFAFLILSISVWNSLIRIADSSSSWASYERSFRSLSSIYELKRA